MTPSNSQSESGNFSNTGWPAHGNVLDPKYSRANVFKQARLSGPLYTGEVVTGVHDNSPLIAMKSQSG
jgi:hypothetical protein